MTNGEIGYTSNIEGFYNPSEKVAELSKGKIPMGKVMPIKVWEDLTKIIVDKTCLTKYNTRNLRSVFTPH